jgi:hypothetical protein
MLGSSDFGWRPGPGVFLVGLPGAGRLGAGQSRGSDRQMVAWSLAAARMSASNWRP